MDEGMSRTTKGILKGVSQKEEQRKVKGDKI
jgi:hypothetical protein